MRLKRNKLSIAQLKKQLKTYDQTEFIELILDCYRKSDEMKTFLTTKFVGESAIEELHEITKEKNMRRILSEKRHPKLRLAEAKKAITDFKKLCHDEAKIIDVMVYYVELGVEFTNDYGDINAAFYNSLISTFAAIVDLLNQKEDASLTLAFRDRLEDIVYASAHIGWGLGINTEELFMELAWMEEDLDEETSKNEWDKLPQEIKDKIVRNVWCGRCSGVTEIVHYQVGSSRNNIFLEGKCKKCEADVARVVD
ncbi:MAG: DUF6155 family protein [Bacillaceae bacterium]|nr:DUF6155 family protein [Bacillaceae bacterium]